MKQFFERWGLPLLAAGVAAVAAHPVLAQGFNAVSGGIDPQTGVQTFFTYALPVVGGGISLIAAKHGIMSAHDPRHLAGGVGGVVGGAGIAFGGPYLVNNW